MDLSYAEWAHSGVGRTRRPKQYRYHPRWRETRDQTKYNRMLALVKPCPPCVTDRATTKLADRAPSALSSFCDDLIRIGNAE